MQDALIIACVFIIGVSIVEIPRTIQKIKQARKRWL